jgi:predicted nucleotidyltransferase component of viral defense system
LCKIILDISLREKVQLDPKIKKIGRFLQEIPVFDVVVMNKKEILAEKIRTIMTRKKARDVYDLIFLIEEEIRFNKKITNDKLKYYKIEFKKQDFLKKVKEKKDVWETELSVLVKEVPNFDKCYKKIKKWLLENEPPKKDITKH